MSFFVVNYSNIEHMLILGFNYFSDYRYLRLFNFGNNLLIICSSSMDETEYRFKIVMNTIILMTIISMNLYIIEKFP